MRRFRKEKRKSMCSHRNPAKRVHRRGGQGGRLSDCLVVLSSFNFHFSFLTDITFQSTITSNTWQIFLLHSFESFYVNWNTTCAWNFALVVWLFDSTSKSHMLSKYKITHWREVAFCFLKSENSCLVPTHQTKWWNCEMFSSKLL